MRKSDHRTETSRALSRARLGRHFEEAAMFKHPPSSDVDVRLGSETQTSPEPLDPETPFRLLVLGDFGGAGAGPLAMRKMHAVDRDVLEEELGRLQVTMDVPLGNGRSARIELRDLDDFHPDRLLERVDVLSEWRKTRERLENPRTFAEAASEVRAWAGPPPERRERAAAPAGGQDDIVGELLAAASRRPKPAADSAFEAELKAIVRPHLAPEEDSDLPRLREAVDEARSARFSAAPDSGSSRRRGALSTSSFVEPGTSPFASSFSMRREKLFSRTSRVTRSSRARASIGAS